MQPKAPNKSDQHANATTVGGIKAYTSSTGTHWTRPEMAEADDLVVKILNCLLGYHALEPYWFCLSQGDLSAEDLLRDRRVDHAVVQEVARLVSQITPR